MMGRSVPPRRTRRHIRTRVVIALIVLASIMVAPAASYTSSSLDRSASNDVVDDPTGAVGLDVAESVRANSVEPLVEVTNNFGFDLSVTVALQNPDDGVLYLDGDDFGDQHTFTVPAGDIRTIDIDVSNQAGQQWQVYFDVTASANGFTFSANDRFTEAQKGGGGGGCQGGNPNC